MSALFPLSIEESPQTLTGTRPDGVLQRCRRGLTTKTDGFPHTVDQSPTARTCFLRAHEECFHRATIARGRCLDESCVFSLDGG